MNLLLILVATVAAAVYGTFFWMCGFMFKNWAETRWRLLSSRRGT